MEYIDLFLVAKCSSSTGQFIVTTWILLATYWSGADAYFYVSAWDNERHEDRAKYGLITRIASH